MDRGQGVAISQPGEKGTNHQERGDTIARNFLGRNRIGAAILLLVAVAQQTLF